jgi:hypothetical protein
MKLLLALVFVGSLGACYSSFDYTVETWSALNPEASSSYQNGTIFLNLETYHFDYVMKSTHSLGSQVFGNSFSKSNITLNKKYYTLLSMKWQSKSNTTDVHPIRITKFIIKPNFEQGANSQVTERCYRPYFHALYPNETYLVGTC